MPVVDEAAPDTLVARVWDLPVRLFHWLLVALLAFSWWSGEQHAMAWHLRSGLAIMALVIFRIYWGFFGGQTARFARFMRGPRALITYARALIDRRARRDFPPSPGHNPIGGWSVMLMLLTLGVMIVAGLFAIDVDGLESGPLAEYVSFDAGRIAAEVHAIVFNVILALTVLHVLAITLYLVALRHDLITPMIHGRRRVDAQAMTGPLGASLWKALVGLAIAATCTFAVAQGFRF